MTASSSRTLDRAARWGLGLAALAWALRAWHVFGTAAGPWFEDPPLDMGYHLEWARTVAAGETFRPGEPFFRAPLYPWFLAGLLRLTGGALLPALLLQAGLGAATAWLTFDLGRRTFGAREGLAAAAAVACGWLLIDFDAQLLVEPLLAPLILAGLVALAPRTGELTARRAAVAGVLFGLAAITRPNVLLVMPGLALWVFLRRRRLLPVLALTLGTLAPILPLTAYNRVACGDTVLIASQGGVNFWIGNNPTSDGRTAVAPGTRAGWWEGYHDTIAQAEAAEGRALRPSEVSQHYTRRALAWAREEPLAFLAHLGLKLRLILAGMELGNNVEPRYTALAHSPWLVLSPVHSVWLVPLGLLGAVCAWPRRKALAPLYIFLVGYGLSVVLFFVNARFRAPMLPVGALFAAHGVFAVWGARGRRRWILGLLAGAGIGLAAIPPRSPVIGAVNGRVNLALGYAARSEALSENGDGPLAQQAIALLQEALELRPDWVPAHRALGALRRRAGDLEGALAAFGQAHALAVAAGTLDEEAIDGYAGALSRAGRLEELAAFVGPLVNGSVRSAGATYYAGVLQQRAGRIERAEALFQASEELRPGRFRVPFALGALAVQRGDDARAREHFGLAQRRIEDALPEQRAQLERERLRLGF